LETIECNLDSFKANIENQDIPDSEIVGQYLTFGTPYIFESNEELYYKLKKSIAEYFSVSHTAVFMVGSSKLGFSIAPHKYLNPIHDESDIDMAIISEALFDSIWKELFEFNIDITSRSEREHRNYNEFLQYFFKGWLRPDKFPFEYKGKNEWFEFFTSISYKEFDKRKVTGAVYRSEYFFTKYHEANIKKIRLGAI
jgi:hypothetical protein